MGRKAKTETIEQPKVEETKVEQPEVEAPKAEQPAEDKSGYVDELLKMYSDYPEIYISVKGGVFAPGTPEHIRGNAVLYKNKYYKQ